MSNLSNLPQPPEIIAALKAAGCGIRRLPVLPPEPASEPPRLEQIQRPARGIDLKTIRSVVAAVCEVAVIDLSGENRVRDVCRARQIFFFAAREMTGASLTAIGKTCGGKDHSTVLHGIQKVEANRDTFEPELSKVLNYMKRRG